MHLSSEAETSSPLPDGVALTYRDVPIYILAAMMFLIPALGVPSELMLQDTLKSAAAAFGILLAALAWVWQGHRNSKCWVWHPMLWAPLALMVYALGSMVWSHTYLAGVEAIRWFLLALLLWLGLNTLTLRSASTVIWGVHGGLVVASVWVVLQFWWNFALFPQGPQPASTFVNRNFFAEYAVTALPFSLWALVQMCSARRAPWVAATVALAVLALLMTGTRSALVALLLLIPVVALTVVRYRAQLHVAQWSRATHVVVCLVMAVVILGGGSVRSDNPQIVRDAMGTTALERSFVRTSSMAQAAEYTTGSFSMRTTMWMATARMVLAHPLTGVGAGAWEVQIPLYQRVDSVLENDYYAHNESLQLLSEYGLVVGGLCLAFLLAYLLHAAGKTWHLIGASAVEAPLRAISLCSVLALLVVSNAGFPWHLAACGTLLAFNMALLGSSDVRLGRTASPATTTSTHSRVKVVAISTFLVACTALAGYITWQAQRAENYLINAIRLAVQYGLADAAGDPAANGFKARALDSVRAGVAINPHYRRLTAEVAEPFAARRDWVNSTWILQSVADSRPHVPVLWRALAAAYAHQGQHDRADQAFLQVQRLKPDSLSTISLRATLLTLRNRSGEAITLLGQQFDAGAFDFEMVQTAYAIGYKAKDWAWVARTLNLMITTWPEQAADGYFRLGTLYTESGAKDEVKAAIAYRQGLASVPLAQRDNYIHQVPEPFKSQMKNKM